MFNQFGQYVPDNPFNQFAARQQGQMRCDIIHVNGRGGAEALQMAANSNVIVLDDTAPLVWLCQTDGAGYKTVTPYTITPYQPKPPVDVSSLESRITKLEEMLNAKSDDANA